jgi:hypothetical protein
VPVCVRVQGPGPVHEAHNDSGRPAGVRLGGPRTAGGGYRRLKFAVVVCPSLTVTEALLGL